MLEIIILGRGGQGAQTAGNLLARAFFKQGKYVQAFATYGGARRGTPVSASLRVDDVPIRLRSNIERPSALLCFDDSLMDAGFLQNADSDTMIVVNSQKSAADFDGLGAYRILPVNGGDIARHNNMGRVVNSALLGAMSAMLDQPDIDIVCDVINETAPTKKSENVASCREAYSIMRATIGGVQS